MLTKEKFIAKFCAYGESSFDFMGLTGRVKRDEWAESPRNHDNLGTMLCEHPRYQLGDFDFNVDYWREIQSLIEVFEYVEDAYWYQEAGADEIMAKFDKYYISLPLYLYDHGGLAMSTGGFSCRWDSGQVGIIYLSKEEAKKYYGWERLSEKRLDKIYSMLNSEVVEYNEFLQGNVFSFEVIDSEGEYLEYSSTYLGSPLESGLLDEAYSIYTALVEIEREKHVKALKTLIRRSVPLIHRTQLLAERSRAYA